MFAPDEISAIQLLARCGQDKVARCGESKNAIEAICIGKTAACPNGGSPQCSKGTASCSTGENDNPNPNDPPELPGPAPIPSTPRTPFCRNRAGVPNPPCTDGGEIACPEDDQDYVAYCTQGELVKCHNSHNTPACT